MILSIPAGRDEPTDSSQEHSKRHLQTLRCNVPPVLQQEIRQTNPVTGVLNVMLQRTALGPVAPALAK